MTAARVLIVDDNELNLELASYLLADDGVQVAKHAMATRCWPRCKRFGRISC